MLIRRVVLYILVYPVIYSGNYPASLAVILLLIKSEVFVIMKEQ